jgi:retron-type reverse transcriptase
VAHLIDVEALERAYHRQRKNAAVGVDGVTKQAYGRDLDANLQDLHGRLKAMRYRHQPIRRVHIPGASAPDQRRAVTRRAVRARREPDAQFHSVAHLIDVAALERAYHRQRKDAAVGVDGVTKQVYGRDLDVNLRDLHGRLKAMRYRHQPIRRVHIPGASAPDQRRAVTRPARRVSAGPTSGGNAPGPARQRRTNVGR